MLLTISTTHQPATDLGYLLHKNPENLHEVTLSFGTVVMAYPEACAQRCTFALTVDIDPVALVRGKGQGEGLLDHYVNDRPYAASSFLSVAIARALNTAFAGRSKHRPELAESALPLTATVTPVPARGSEDIAERLFAPLGYTVKTAGHLLDEENPDWGDSAYIDLEVAGQVRLADLLAHLYVLLPVLDNSKHYYVAQDEVEKLLAKGAGWLEGHPEKDVIVNRYLKRRRRLVREALARLDESQAGDPDETDERQQQGEQALEQPIRLNDVRMQRVTQVLAGLGAKRVVDLGCGEGRLLRELLGNKQFVEVVGVDASLRALEVAERRLKLDRMSERQRKRIALLHGALTYRDRRLAGYDAAALVEVIEHVDLDQLPSLERAVFEFMAPKAVVVTTPNREYNALFETLPADRLRHGDHRFEWRRDEFRDWAARIAEAHRYTFEIGGIGEEDERLGAPTQMAVFQRMAG
ncbi:3' terminal RNA ribose 2'-O-methyltransferase Hen1 [Algihabitans albus]|uniref:3' terminal RNA ribose 2'-O-methyltransferase Hen1 n=1 Tax=Algihabitans albus TaxID=2164067 RepID=UPI0035D12FB3